MTPDIVLDANLRNPGEFHACCGVFEIAGALWPESEAWFEDRAFCVVAHAKKASDPLAEIVRRIVATTPIAKLEADAPAYDESIAPVTFVPLGMRLDWWLKTASLEAEVLKLWAGQQAPAKNILPPLQQALATIPADGLNRRLLHTRRAVKGRFGVDPVPAWDAIDVGFSPDEQSLAVLTSPATEIFAAVGLQGFRPLRFERRRFEYVVWRRPLPLLAARMASVLGVEGRRFRFSVVNRNAQYKSFGMADEIEERDDD